MANRVTHDDVVEIIDTSLTDTTPFITAANLIVTNRLSGEGVGSSTLAEIERWLAAHFVAIRSQDAVSKQEKTGEASITRHGVTGKGLDFTPYGQQVKLLDPTGKLSDLGKKAMKFETIDV